MNKKISLKYQGSVLSLGFGVILDTPRKYSRPLLFDKSTTSFVLRRVFFLIGCIRPVGLLFAEVKRVFLIGL